MMVVTACQSKSFAEFQSILVSALQLFKPVSPTISGAQRFQKGIKVAAQFLSAFLTLPSGIHVAGS